MMPLVLRLMLSLPAIAPFVAVLLFRPLGWPYVFGLVLSVLPWTLAYQAIYGVEDPAEWFERYVPIDFGDSQPPEDSDAGSS